MTTFEEKVRSMTAKEIIMAMVDSLTPPSLIKIEMNSFGYYRSWRGIFSFLKKPVCYGCAATNTICKISGVTFTHENITDRLSRALAVKSTSDFIELFEEAIDDLRKGDIREYNNRARKGRFATINDSGRYLPHLNSDYSESQLESYAQLANSQL